MLFSGHVLGSAASRFPWVNVNLVLLRLRNDQSYYTVSSGTLNSSIPYHNIILHLPKSALRSLDFVVISFLLKLFRTANNEIIHDCALISRFFCHVNCYKRGWVYSELISCDVLVCCNILALGHSMLIPVRSKLIIKFFSFILILLFVSLLPRCW